MRDSNIMNSTKSKTTMVIGTIIVLVAGALTVLYWKRTRPNPIAEQQAANISSAVSQINRVNVGRPDLQVQAKTLIYAALIQKQIPPASKWCETFNVGGNFWPATLTNTYFSINSQVAGGAYSRTNPPSGQVVVFLETANLERNLAGGSDLVANNPDGVAVALADGRAMIVPQNEVRKLRWKP